MENIWQTRVGVLAVCTVFISVGLHFYEAGASDPSLLQDFCIGVDDPSSAVFVNGFLCKNPKKVTARDFIYKGFNQVGDTNNNLRSNVTLVDIQKFPALNTQGVSVAHVDYGPLGLNTPHHHPRASEVLIVLSGTIYAGLITSDYKLLSAVLNPGDLFVFPQGLIHFQYNLKKSSARVITAFGSQYPGRIDTPHALFGTTPSILDDVLTKAYQVDDEIIQELRFQFSDALNGIEIEKFGKKLPKDV